MVISGSSMGVIILGTGGNLRFSFPVCEFLVTPGSKSLPCTTTVAILAFSGVGSPVVSVTSETHLTYDKSPATKLIKIAHHTLLLSR
jgi:hypothetical protein